MILGRDFAGAMQGMFEKDLADSDQIRLEEWKSRGFTNYFKEWFSNLLKHWL